MVQKIAKEMIQLARQEAAQDIYLIPKSSCYELYMRVGDERRFIQTYDFCLRHECRGEEAQPARLLRL